MRAFLGEAPPKELHVESSEGYGSRMLRRVEELVGHNHSVLAPIASAAISQTRQLAPRRDTNMGTKPIVATVSRPSRMRVKISSISDAVNHVYGWGASTIERD